MSKQHTHRQARAYIHGVWRVQTWCVGLNMLDGTYTHTHTHMVEHVQPRQL